MQRPLVRPAHEGLLDAAMLVAQRDLQVRDLLAMTLEAEMARFDDAGMHGADRDLVDLFALDAVVVHDADQRMPRRPLPGVVAGPVRGVEADRLEPRMFQRPHAKLLRDLALEQVDLRTCGRQRWVSVAVERGGRHVQVGAASVGQDGHQVDTSRRRLAVAEQRSHTLAALNGTDHGPAKLGQRQQRHLLARHRLAVEDRLECGCRHGLDL